jgi:5-formyltetrahydrofolate cyclo-ligase
MGGMPPEPPSDAVAAKRALRAELRERRRIRPRLDRDTATEQLTQQLIAITSTLGPTTLSCYLSMPDEPETRPFLTWACEHNIRVLLPVSRDDGLLDWAPYDAAHESIDTTGMPVPNTELLGPIAINDVGLIFVPAAAVDRTGMRMGWGRGYFDKTLGSMDRRPTVFAVIFDGELVQSLPSEPHDQSVDGAVTPSGIVRFTP